MPNPISINPVAIFEYFRARGNRDHDQIAAYFADMATEVRSLAQAWESAIAVLLSDASKDGRDAAMKALFDSDYYMPRNGAPYMRLMSFYENVSTAVAGKLPPERMNSIVSQLAVVLRQRDVSRKALEQILTEMRSYVFLHQDNISVDLHEISELPQVLYREAVALDILAKTIRVQLG